MTYTQFRQSIPVDEARALLIRAGLTPLNVVCLHEEVVATIEPVTKAGGKLVQDQSKSVMGKLEGVGAMMTMFDTMENRVHFRVIKESREHAN